MRFAPDQHLHIGSLIFDRLDQIDLTGPYEVLSAIPNATVHIGAKKMEVVKDFHGLPLYPTTTLRDMPKLDILHVPGGPGQQNLMEDEEVLGFIRRQAAEAAFVFSVCTGALLAGAAGLLKGRRATTHWASMEVLPLLGAIPVNERVVIDGNWVFAAGVTSGIDGALRLAAMARGDDVAKQIQLYMQYQPEPPFDSGTPEQAPPHILARQRDAVAALTAARIETAKRVGEKLGLVSSVVAD
ncbi:DJ-1/PfpI family protein [Rhizobium lusitanum]|uniref:DJ-1/PfpI family protein n=1 Tax=Rhizobium lusitanum TaxID=293958 RepID=A0A6L9UIX9_9HYPH|nr:DJ-1/PfpI family protein [Rhizobium lusitanum]NEI74046.1 DJ-1/PfpI family protein [Rhizobium lusitanum]